MIKQLNVTATGVLPNSLPVLPPFPPLAWERGWVFASSYVPCDQRLLDQSRTQGPRCHPTSDENKENGSPKPQETLLRRGVGGQFPRNV